MKKGIFITLIVAAMVSFASTSIYSQTGSGLIGSGSFSSRTLITYQVNVYPTGDFARLFTTFYVVMTDEGGRNVAPPQLYKPGQQTYIFKEAGPVAGQRVANLLSKDPKTEYYVAPDVMSDTFLGGKTYVFKLNPVVQQQ